MIVYKMTIDNKRSNNFLNCAYDDELSNIPCSRCHCLDRRFKGRIEIHMQLRDRNEIAYVYIFKDAKGLSNNLVEFHKVPNQLLMDVVVQ
jgi:hypothetical protein